MYSCYGQTFDSAGSWSLDSDTARNFILSGVDNGLSLHAEKLKINFLVLGEDPRFGVNGSFVLLKKKLSISFSKTKTKLCLSLHYNAECSYLLNI